MTRPESIVFGVILSGLMSLLVSGITILRTDGFGASFGILWGSAWIASWAVAFPVVLIVAPIARRLVVLIFRSSAGKES